MTTENRGPAEASTPFSLMAEPDDDAVEEGFRDQCDMDNGNQPPRRGAMATTETGTDRQSTKNAETKQADGRVGTRSAGRPLSHGWH